MKTKHALLLGGAALLVVAWAVFGRATHDKTASDHVPPVPVTSAQVVPRTVALSLVGIGTVQANNTVTIRARVDGELMNVAFTEGQDVKKGDVLAQIDPRPFQAALDNATATLAKDKAALANAKRDL